MMKRVCLFWSVVVLSVLCGSVGIAFGQKRVGRSDRVFKAVVLDAKTREALSMARVEVEELDLRLGTDADGRFQIRLFQPDKKYTIRISYLGYKSHEALVGLGDGKEVTFMLQPSSYALEGI